MKVVAISEQWPVYHLTDTVGRQETITHAKRAFIRTGIPQVLMENGRPIGVIMEYNAAA